MLDSIKDSFTESIQIQIAAAEALPDAITHAAQAMVASLLNGNKILCCGNGGSSSNAQQFVSCLLNRFETERPSLPAMALTADNNDMLLPSDAGGGVGYTVSRARNGEQAY